MLESTGSRIPRSATQSELLTPQTKVGLAGSCGRPLHIIMTVNAAWNIWNFRRPLVSALLADGHNVTVVAPRDDSAGDLEGLGCRFVPLQMDVKGINPITDAALTLRLRHLFATERPDVILSYTIKNNIYGALAARSLRIPFIPNVTGLGTAFLSGGPLQLLATFLYRLAFARLPIIFFQNEDDRELFYERQLIDLGQTRLLPGSGIDLEHFAPAPYPEVGSQTIFLMIARLLRDKGVHEFIEAALLVRHRYPLARFQLLGAAGSINRSAIDLKTVSGWKASHGVEYLGTSSDVRPEIAQASCVVLPSYREGAPRTLIEAAAMARAVIATDVPGCRDVVDDGDGGFLCEARSGTSLAAACFRFLELGPEARAEMGRAGRRKMEREYDQALVTRAYRDALADVTAKATPHDAQQD